MDGHVDASNLDDDRAPDPMDTTVPERATSADSDAVKIVPESTADLPENDQQQVQDITDTTTASTPSVAPTDDTTVAPTTYGTRSRNRGGASRPNYAEDKELDHDFEIQATQSKPESTRKTARPIDSSTSGKLANGHATIAQTGQGTNDESSIQSQATGKDQIPGMSSFSVASGNTSSAPTSKKRKAPVSTAPLSNPYLTQSLNALNQSTARKGSISTQVMNGYRETCMLSFDKCGAKLHDRKLVSDDGIVLGINGKQYFHLTLLFNTKSRRQIMYTWCVNHRVNPII